jgi:cytoskeletal protein RodZ
MEPEEIDKLFRDKLAGRPALPSPDAWMRLQQKMEPPKKERTMWIYYAAASVVVLLLAGLVYFQNGMAPAGPAVATAPRVTAPSRPTAPHPIATPEINRQLAPSLAQAPVSSPATSNSPVTAGALRPAKKRQAQRLPARAPEAAAPALAASRPAPAAEPATATPQTQPAVQPAALASAAPDLKVVEVVVTRGPGSSSGEDLTLRENLSRKGHLLKNIYKQARNLKNGDPVELATLGIDKSRIQEETKELKQKITNVISL